MSHYIVKLASGEFVYGVINKELTDKKMLVLENPLVWEEYETEEGSGSALVKYCTGTKEKEIPISISSIVSMVTMSPTFSNFYDAAVAVQQITDDAYDERIRYMTVRMIDMVMDYQNRLKASEEDSLVISSSRSSNTTIH